MFGKITAAFSQLHADLTGIRATLERATDSLQEAQSLPSEYLGLADRVSELEGALEGAMGQARGLVTEAESRFAAARAAEERSRGMMKRAERLQTELAEGDEEGLEPLDYIVNQLPQGDANGGQEQAMPPMRDPLADRVAGKDAATRAKWGI